MDRFVNVAMAFITILMLLIFAFAIAHRTNGVKSTAVQIGEAQCLACNATTHTGEPCR